MGISVDGQLPLARASGWTQPLTLTQCRRKHSERAQSSRLHAFFFSFYFAYLRGRQSMQALHLLRAHSPNILKPGTRCRSPTQMAGTPTIEPLPAAPSGVYPYVPRKETRRPSVSTQGTGTSANLTHSCSKQGRVAGVWPRAPVHHGVTSGLLLQTLGVSHMKNLVWGLSSVLQPQPQDAVGTWGVNQQTGEHSVTPVQIN